MPSPADTTFTKPRIVSIIRIRALALIPGIVLLFCWPCTSLADDSNIRTYGYFDMEMEVGNKDAASGNWTFDQHHFNVISIYQIDRDFRVVAEAEWEHGPSISASSSTGKIYLAKSFLEYKKNDGFQVRMGKFLSPYGIYNERHDATPTFISTQLAQSVYGSHRLSTTIRDRLFAKHTTGLQARGDLYFNKWEVAYAAYLGNGRGENPSEKDDNPNKAVGARLVLVHPGSGLQFGASLYDERNGLDADARLTTLGFDIQFDHDDLHIEAESISSWIEKVGPTTLPNDPAKIPRGYYVQISYTFFEALTPFVRLERFDPDAGSSTTIEKINVLGLNQSINPRVVIKGELLSYLDRGAQVNNSYKIFLASIAVAF